MRTRLSLIALFAMAAGCARGNGTADSGGGPGSGPEACTPGTSSCQDGRATFCRPDGILDEYDCDATQKLQCLPNGCAGQCSHETLGSSYLGCDYYPTVSLNPVWSGFDFAVAIANTKDTATNVLVTRGDMTVDQRSVQPNAVEVIKLPWVPELKGGDFNDWGGIQDLSGPTRLVSAGAYRVQTDQPVTVYQYNSLEYSLPTSGNGCPAATDGSGGCYSYSNDSSLLLPANAYGRSYTALSWPSMPVSDTVDSAGFFTITAAADDTEVQLSALGELAPGAGIDSAGKGMVTLQAGDVLEVVAAPGVQAMGQLGAPLVFGPDISGTRVFSNKPVSVLSGHRCAFVPNAGTGYCDHVEEAMFPTTALGKDYIVSAPSAPTGTKWRYVLAIAAVEQPTLVHFDPPIVGDAMIEPGSPPLRVPELSTDLHVTGDHALLVAQYLQGSTSQPTTGAVPQEGDPAESLAVPTEQFRNVTLFSSSTTYDKNFVNVIAPVGATVTLDGAPIAPTEFKAVGSSGFAVARHTLPKTEVHTISSDAAIGVVVYGYGKYTSYMNPGGLDLKAITGEQDPPK